MTVMTSARERAVAARHLRGLGHARLRARPERRPLRQQPDHCRDPAAATRARAAAGLCDLRRLRARHAHGEERQAGARFPRRSGAALPPGGAPRVRRARGVRRPQARGLGPRLLQRAPAGEPLQGVAGGAAPLLSAAQSALRPVHGHRAAVRHHGARAARRGRLASDRALLRSRGSRRANPRRVLPGSLFARREAQRRVDGRMRRRQIAPLRQCPARRAAGVQLHGAGRLRRPRSSRTTR